MNPLAIGLLLVVCLAAFARSASRRWRLMMIGAPLARFDQLGTRLRLTLRYAIGQQRLTRYRLAGLAHKAIFFGFLVLSLRSLILFGRGLAGDPDFGFWLFDRGTPAGNFYSLLKDVYIVLVILGTIVFLHLRLVVRPARMTLGREGIVILAMILAMMIADVVYDGAGQLVAARTAAAAAATPAAFNIWEPLGSVAAMSLRPLPDTAIGVMWRVGYWTHVTLVLAFLNLLPYSKHFHIITAIPNVFLQDLERRGRLRPIEDIEGRVERDEPLGVAPIEQLTWKGILDLYSCTECGRCTDHCPATRTGKRLAPSQLTIDLREFLYEHDTALIRDASDASGAGDGGDGHRRDIVPGVIDPEVVWACTTCGACEQECPVLITYVDKIVDLRRHLVQERGEFPPPLQEAFQSIEVTGSVYGVAADERLAWADGLEVPRRAQVPEVDVLFWVGCAPATDERARNVTRAMARLLDLAGVAWAVLGDEESCTGDVARRAGNEFLFQVMAQANVEVLNGYGTKRIVTTCPHCYNTLKNEYPDFGGHYEVVHHSEFLAELITAGKLRPEHRVDARIAYHDSCYLGRYNDVYSSPRDVLASIPGVVLVEASDNRDRGMCCGAGGAQMFKEDEPGRERVSVARSRQLLETRADTVCTACPFCMRMLTDALGSTKEADVRQLDIAEALLQSVSGQQT